MRDANPFIVALPGYSRRELTGKHLWGIVAFKDIAEGKRRFRELQGQDYVRYETLPFCTSRWVLV